MTAAYRATDLAGGPIQVGVIGGSGFYQISGLVDTATIAVDTPFGRPSDDLVIGTLNGVRVAFLPRHGVGHRLSPSELPARANVYAFKMLGATHLLSISAVGSLREELAPRSVVVPDQLIDRTRGGRPATFFGEGLVVHVSLAEPLCAETSRILFDAARETGPGAHAGGTLVVIEGPQFSTKAESRLYRQWGAHLVGMTALPEARLAREAELCYATLALVTDYDCWHESEEAVTAEMVVANTQANVARAKAIVSAALPRIVSTARTCACSQALANAIMTGPDTVPAAKRKQVDLLIGKYLT